MEERRQLASSMLPFFVSAQNEAVANPFGETIVIAALSQLYGRVEDDLI